MAPQQVKKQLAESLVLSRLDYGDTVYQPLPIVLQTKLQRVQNAAASFVTNQYSSEKDVLKLGWLPINERVKFHMLKNTHQAMHNPHWPDYLCLKLHEPGRILRSSEAPRIHIPLVKGTFQDIASTLFNELPVDVRLCNDSKLFNRQVKQILTKQAKLRLCFNE